MEIATVMGKQLPRIKDIGDGLISTPFPSGSVHVGKVTMMRTKTGRIERNPENQGHNLISMPTTFEEENVQQYNALDHLDAVTVTNLEAGAPPRESTQTTREKDCIWKKVIRKEKIFVEKNGPGIITIVGKKQRLDARNDIDGKKKTKGQVVHTSRPRNGEGKCNSQVVHTPRPRKRMEPLPIESTFVLIGLRHPEGQRRGIVIMSRPSLMTDELGIMTASRLW
nr:hypothetical protein CFP56_17414 [Quercus suber]